MGAFTWEPFNSDSFGTNISKYVQGLKCRATNLVAYYIPDKHNINKDFQFDGDFEPLKNNYGIYFLFDDAKSKADKKPTIYVGQTSPYEKTKGMARIKTHANSTTEWYRNEWESIIYVTSTDNSWNKGLLDTLEMLFIACFMNREEYKSLNTMEGKDGNIQEKDFKTELLAITDLLARVNALHSKLSAYWSESKENLPATKYLDCDIMLFWWLEKNKDLTTKQQIEELYSYISNCISGPITYEGLKRRKLQLDTKGLIPYNV